MRKNHSKIICIKLVHLPYLGYSSFTKFWTLLCSLYLALISQCLCFVTLYVNI